MTDEQMKRMAERFLAWKLPDDFNPDGGIGFDRHDRGAFNRLYWPTGTNLLTYTQALAMVNHMVEIEK